MEPTFDLLLKNGPFGILSFVLVIGGKWVFGQFLIVSQVHRDELAKQRIEFQQLTEKMIRVLEESVRINAQIEETIRTLVVLKCLPADKMLEHISHNENEDG